MSTQLEHVKINGIWYWKCPICGALLAPVKIDQKSHQQNSSANFQSKGAASRHLMTHDPSLVNHNRSISECQYKHHKIRITPQEEQYLKTFGCICKKIPYFKGYVGLGIAINNKGEQVAILNSTIDIDKTNKLEENRAGPTNMIIKFYPITLESLKKKPKTKESKP